MPSNFMVFDDVLEELQIGADELKEMVSNEEIRCFRDGGKMKFRTDDVFALKAERETQPTIILPSDEADALFADDDEANAPVISGLKEAEPDVIVPPEAPAAEIEEPEPALLEPAVDLGEDDTFSESAVAAEPTPATDPFQDKLTPDLVTEDLSLDAPVSPKPPMAEDELAPTMLIDATDDEPAGGGDMDELVPTMIIDEPIEEGATVDITAADDLDVATVDLSADIDLKDEETILPADGSLGDEEDSATVIGDEDLVVAALDDDDDVMADVKPDELGALAPMGMASQEVLVPVHPLFNVLLIVGILVLLFSGLVIVDIVREPVEMPSYLKSICDAILSR